MQNEKKLVCTNVIMLTNFTLIYSLLEYKYCKEYCNSSRSRSTYNSLAANLTGCNKFRPINYILWDIKYYID